MYKYIYIYIYHMFIWFWILSSALVAAALRIGMMCRISPSWGRGNLENPIPRFFFTTPQETIVNSVVGDFHRTMCSVSILGEDFGITQMGCFTNFWDWDSDSVCLKMRFFKHRRRYTPKWPSFRIGSRRWNLHLLDLIYLMAITVDLRTWTMGYITLW